MTITVNGEPFDMANKNTVGELLELTGQLHLGGLAVAVNEMVIPKGKWQQTALTSTDKVLIIKASQGG